MIQIRSRMRFGVLVVLLALVAAPASAANREHQQMMADIRMLQEQSQQLQNLIGSIGEAIKAVNARLDEQATATRKMFADQKLVIDTLSNDLRVVREKLDDNNVRVGSLTQELEAMRQSVVQLSAPRPAPPEPDPGPASPDAPTASTSSAPAGATAPPPPALGVSPTRAWEMAFSDYTAGQYDFAIQGFEAYLLSFPRAEQADNAQVYVGNSYLQQGNNQKALEAYDKAIRNYPTGDAIPEAYFKKGLALSNLGQRDQARDAWNYVIKTYPGSAEASLAQQALARLKP